MSYIICEKMYMLSKKEEPSKVSSIRNVGVRVVCCIKDSGQNKLTEKGRYGQGLEGFVQLNQEDVWAQSFLGRARKWESTEKV